MNQWLLIRRMRLPAFLLLFGLTALLHEWHILSFGRSWPLYLVLAGVFGLVERLVFPQDELPPAPAAYPGPYPPPAGWSEPAAGTSLATVAPGELERTEGGQ